MTSGLLGSKAPHGTITRYRHHKCKCPLCLEVNRQRSAYYRKRGSSIKLPQYEELLRTQGGVCAGCLTAPTDALRLAVDHDHTTGEVRGLLCRGCNTGLGQLRDDVVRLRRLADYLEAKRS